MSGVIRRLHISAVRVVIFEKSKRQCLDESHREEEYNDGVSPKPRISFAGFEILHLYIILLKENELASFLEVCAEFFSREWEF